MINWYLKSSLNSFFTLVFFRAFRKQLSAKSVLQHTAVSKDYFKHQTLLYEVPISKFDKKSVGYSLRMFSGLLVITLEGY